MATAVAALPSVQPATTTGTSRVGAPAAPAAATAPMGGGVEPARCSSWPLPGAGAPRSEPKKSTGRRLGDAAPVAAGGGGTLATTQVMPVVGTEAPCEAAAAAQQGV
jgi:hypothetical protein